MSDNTSQSVQRTCDDKHALYHGSRKEVMRRALETVVARVPATIEQARRNGLLEAQIMTLRSGRDFRRSLPEVFAHALSPLSVTGLASRLHSHLLSMGYEPHFKPIGSSFKRATYHLVIPIKREPISVPRYSDSLEVADAQTAEVMTAMGKAQVEAERMLERFDLVQKALKTMEKRIHRQSRRGEQFAQLDEIIHPDADVDAFGDNWVGDTVCFFKTRGYKIHVDTQEFHEPVTGRGWSTLITVSWGDEPRIPQRKLRQKPGTGR